jgi:hypothetical protein
MGYDPRTYKGNPAAEGATAARVENEARERLRAQHGKLDVDKELAEEFKSRKGYYNVHDKLARKKSTD